MIKSTAQDQAQEKEEKLSFPVLMIDSGYKFIVLFYGPVNGIVVHTTDEALHKVGTRLDYWKPAWASCWRKYEGVVELCNQV